ncbi:MAG: beta strand repeat-containing protein, partial [Cytophagaceae bacterium]
MRALYLLLVAFFVFFLQSNPLFGQSCTGCNNSVNVTSTPAGGISLPGDATGNNRTICLTGSGTYTGTINLNGRTGITICVESGVTFNGSLNGTWGSPLNLTVNNYGTWNNTSFVVGGATGIVYNNYGTLSVGNITISDGLNLNNYGTFTAASFQLNTGSPLVTNHPGSTATFTSLHISANATFVNNGSLNVTTNVAIQGTLNSNGTLNVTGQFKVDNGAARANITGGATFGSFETSSGITTIGSLVTVLGNSLINGGTIQGTGPSCAGFVTNGTFSMNAGNVTANGGLTINKNPVTTWDPNTNYAIDPLVNVNSGTTPTINTHPANTTVCVGSNATFSVSAAGAGLTYQWQFRTSAGAAWQNIAGATSASYTVNGATASMNGYQYRVIIYNCPASVNSNAATLTVNPTPSLVITNPATICQINQYTTTVNTVDLTLPAVTAGSTAGLAFSYFTDAAGTNPLATPAAVTSSGTYYIRGQLSPGCVTSIQPVTVNITTVATPTSPNLSRCGNGMISLVAAGSTGSYRWYLPSGGHDMSNPLNLSISTTQTYYVVGVSGTCESPRHTVVATVHNNPTATVTVTNVSCFGGTNGSVTISSPSGGGTGTYQYNFNGGGWSATTTYNGLSAGTYTLSIRDAADATCVTNLPNVVITQPAAAVSGSTALTHVLCNGGATGAINLTPAGGVGPYTFNWGGGITTEDRSGLTAGNYSVTITDANNCTAVVNATITQPAAAVSGSTVLTHVLCNGGNTGAINLTPAGGVGPYTFNWG